MRSSVITAALLAALSALSLCAQPTQPAAAGPASAPSGAVGLKVHVDEVSGIVRVRADEKAVWQKVTAGMDIDEGAEFQTGPKSFVRCSIPPDQSFTLDRLGTVKVLQAIQNGNKVKTDMLMKYGRTKYAIEAAGLEHESTIASPSSTLAVRGTRTVTYDQPPFAYVVETDHQVQLRDVRRTIALGSNKSSAKVKIEAGKNTAADTALASSVTDPRFGFSRTQSENVYIAQQISRGGVLSFDPLANILVVRNSNPITNDAQFVRSLPSGLDFTVRWNSNADVNLGVFSQFGDPQALLFSGQAFVPTEYLYPGYGLNVSKSGGQIPFDDRGGPKGGTELAFYKNPPKGAVYGLTATLISGGTTEIEFNAFLNGKGQNVFGTDASNNLVKALTFKLTLTSAQPQTALVFIPAVPVLEQTVPDQSQGREGPPATPTPQTARARRAAVADAAVKQPITGLKRVQQAAPMPIVATSPRGR